MVHTRLNRWGGKWGRRLNVKTFFVHYLTTSQERVELRVKFARNGHSMLPLAIIMSSSHTHYIVVRAWEEGSGDKLPQKRALNIPSFRCQQNVEHNLRKSSERARARRCQIETFSLLPTRKKTPWSFFFGFDLEHNSLLPRTLSTLKKLSIFPARSLCAVRHVLSLTP